MNAETNKHIELPKLPYRGLSSFRYLDRNIFGGRDTDIEKLYIMLLKYRGILLYGPSGIGKSSVIKAGLAPLFVNTTFNEKKLSPVIIRVNPNYENTFLISRISTNEDKTAFLPTIFDHLIDSGQAPHRKLNISFSTFKQTISDLSLDLNLPDGSRKETNNIPVLVFDQFEEFITLFEEKASAEKVNTRANKHTQLQKDIIEFLTECYFDQSLPIKLVFSFREDYFTKLGKIFRSFPDIKDNYYHLEALDPDQLKKIISRPFDNIELSKSHFGYVFSTELIKLLVSKLDAYYLDKKVDLTEVQIVCFHIYDKKNDDEGKKSLEEEGIDKILEHFYKNLLDNLKPEEKPLAIDILSLLVLNDKTRNVIHAEEIYTKLSAAPQEKSIDDVIKELESGIKLIRRENRQGQTYFEIISEAIIPYINSKKIEKEKNEELKAQQIKIEKEKNEELKAREIEIEKEREAALKVKQRLYYISAFLILVLIGVAIDLRIVYLKNVKESIINEIKRKNETWYEKFPTDSLRNSVIDILYKYKTNDSTTYPQLTKALELASQSYFYRDNFNNNAALAVAYKAFSINSNQITQRIFRDCIKSTIMPAVDSIENGERITVEPGLNDRYFLSVAIKNKNYFNLWGARVNTKTRENITPDLIKEELRLAIVKAQNPYYIFYSSNRCYAYSFDIKLIGKFKMSSNICYIWPLKDNSLMMVYTNGSYEQYKISQNGLLKLKAPKRQPIIKKGFLSFEYQFTNKLYARFKYNGDYIILKIANKGGVTSLEKDNANISSDMEIVDISKKGVRLLTDNRGINFYIEEKNKKHPIKGRKYAAMSPRGDSIVTNFYNKAYITIINSGNISIVKTDSVISDLPLLFTPSVSPKNSNYIFYIKGLSYLAYNSRKRARSFLFIPTTGKGSFINDDVYSFVSDNKIYSYDLNRDHNYKISDFNNKYSDLLDKFIENDSELSDLIDKYDTAE